jgi:hypothetical protein
VGAPGWRQGKAGFWLRLLAMGRIGQQGCADLSPGTSCEKQEEKAAVGWSRELALAAEASGRAAQGRTPCCTASEGCRHSEKGGESWKSGRRQGARGLQQFLQVLPKCSMQIVKQEIRQACNKTHQFPLSHPSLPLFIPQRKQLLVVSVFPSVMVILFRPAGSGVRVQWDMPK